MTTMPIRKYAEKHGLSADSIAESLSEEHDTDIGPDDDAAIVELDDFRETVYASSIAEIQEVAERVDDAADDLRSATEGLRQVVQEALEDGLPAARLAQVLGVSRARVYQIRDGKR